uniref:ATP-dependent zinc metalloprotease YME1 homolog n=1 Tax=Crassostrea virginica TaxID=6565 RepID=A0A8B8CBL9_CRAVI|nr:ATP-dependent zinc metalloprotease YME1 homolog [Crassostrea virginica]
MASQQRKHIERLLQQITLCLRRQHSLTLQHTRRQHTVPLQHTRSHHTLSLQHKPSRKWPPMQCLCMRGVNSRGYASSTLNGFGFYKRDSQSGKTNEVNTENMTSQQETIDNSSTSSSEITERDIEKQIAKIEDEINALSQRSKRMEKSKRTKHQAEGVMLLLWLYFVYMMYKTDLADMLEKMDRDGLIRPEKANVTFDDVIGIDEVKEELQTIVNYLKDPQKYTGMGATMPRGLLMTGPPGCGKTFLAKATAGEAKVNFYYIPASSLENKYVGTGAKHVRDVFNVAKSHAPSVVFIDEIDSIGTKRDESRMDRSFAFQTLHQLLVELDGFEKNSGVIVIAATNRAKSLDWALTRPGRFDMVVSVPLPDVQGREDMFRYYLTKVRHDSSIDVNKLARATLGCSGADISNIVNQAAFQAARAGEREVNMGHLEYAKEKILDGQLKATKLDEETINVIAVREAAYALVAHYSQYGTPLHKTSILMRGKNIGLTKLLSERHPDVQNMDRNEVLARLDFFMAGRVAENMIFGKDHVMKGSGNNLWRATNLARSYVANFGLSEKVGTRVFSREDEELASPEYQDLLNKEINTLLKDAYKRAEDVLHSHKKELLMLADNLKKYETLSKEEVKTLLQGKQLQR